MQFYSKKLFEHLLQNGRFIIDRLISKQFHVSTMKLTRGSYSLEITFRQLIKINLFNNLILTNLSVRLLTYGTSSGAQKHSKFA